MISSFSMLKRRALTALMLAALLLSQAGVNCGNFCNRVWSAVVITHIN